MKLLLPCIVFAILCTVYSCTKTDNVKTTIYDTVTKIYKDTIWEKQPRNPIVGLWVGTFKNPGDAIDSFYYSYAIDSNGVMYATDINGPGASSSATGPWQLNGTAFTATLTAMNGTTPEGVQSTSAVYDSVQGTLTGQVSVVSGAGSSLSFYLIRVQ